MLWAAGCESSSIPVLPPHPGPWIPSLSSSPCLPLSFSHHRMTSPLSSHMAPRNAQWSPCDYGPLCWPSISLPSTPLILPPLWFPEAMRAFGFFPSAPPLYFPSFPLLPPPLSPKGIIFEPQGWPKSSAAESCNILLALSFLPSEFRGDVLFLTFMISG